MQAVQERDQFGIVHPAHEPPDQDVDRPGQLAELLVRQFTQGLDLPAPVGAVREWHPEFVADVVAELPRQGD